MTEVHRGALVPALLALVLALSPLPAISAGTSSSSGSSSTGSTTTAPKSTTSTAGQYTNESQAKAHCPSDTVVWANLSSKVYHFSGNKDYGTTKKGAYMCEKDAQTAGIRAAKNEKHP